MTYMKHFKVHCRLCRNIPIITSYRSNFPDINKPKLTLENTLHIYFVLFNTFKQVLALPHRLKVGHIN